MRQITRRVTVVVLALLVFLLALGALPSYLGSGDPYYLTATPVSGNQTAIDVATLPADRYPYTTGGLGNATSAQSGRSEPYWRGPIGIKGAFTHSPFDELDALAQRNGSAVDGEAVYVRQNDTIYRLAVAQHP